MEAGPSPNVERCKNSPTKSTNPADSKSKLMSKEDRKQLVLEYLAHTGLGLPPLALYRNLRLRQNATFSEKTLYNYLEELEADDLVMRIDPDAMVDRELKEIDDGQAYWIATESGQQEAGGSFSFR